MISIFKNIFSKKEELDIDFSQIAVDMHSHLIPGIDDGSKSMADTVAMLQGFKDLGYKKIITTPHIMSDYYQNSPETILPKALEIDKKLGGSIAFSAAAEYYSDSEFLQKLKEEDLLCISENKLLFEFSFLEEPTNVNDVVFQIQLQGYQPILAHPERYPYFTKKNKGIARFRELAERGVDLQLNMLSLIGHYGPEVKKTAEQLIDANLVSWVSSDCHHLMHMKLIKEKVSKSIYLQKLIDSGDLKNRSLL